MQWLRVGLACLVLASSARAQTNAEAPDEAKPATHSRFWGDDGWLDFSGFLEEKYGFLPVVVPITEPAVGYGAAVGLLFLSGSLAQARDGFGRPSITTVAGFGTQNGTYGGLAADSRYWLDDRLQTQVGALYGSVNLDFSGIGRDSLLAEHPQEYNLRPVGGLARASYRFGDTRLWGGLGYVYSATRVRFDAPEDTPRLPAFERDSNVGGVTPSLTWDTRDNVFTPTRGTYLGASGGIFVRALGSDDNFQRAELIGLQYFPLGGDLYLGLRGEVDASFGETPFYLRPYISLRGAPAMRYQGEEVAVLEGELRWQLWKRFSLVGFVGGGAAWNDFERFDETQSVLTGGAGFRYEIARAFGIHMGIDVGFGRDTTAVYVQVGSAWARP